MDTRSLARHWEIDAARGIAIGMMIVYHAAFNLATFGDFPIEPLGTFWRTFSHATAASFIFLAGLALTLSHARATRGGTRPPGLWRQYLLRGARIFNWGLAITLVTWQLFPQAPIIFGILHLLGLSIPLAYPLLRLRFANLALGAGFLLLGLALRDITLDTPWLVWLGLQPTGFTSLDYRPLVPWFGVLLLGVFVGNTLYTRSERSGLPIGRDRPALAAPLALLGRHSLAIYLIHQPLLLALLWALGLIDLGFLF